MKLAKTTAAAAAVATATTTAEATVTAAAAVNLHNQVPWQRQLCIFLKDYEYFVLFRLLD